LQNCQAELKEQYIQDEETLKIAMGLILTDMLSSKITEIMIIERETYKSLAMLYINYHEAAIEMMPSIIKRLIIAYSQLVQSIVLLKPNPAATEPEQLPSKDEDLLGEIYQLPPKEEDLSADTYQLEALIEQLRSEKQDFADKFKHSKKLLSLIAIHYKEQLGIGSAEQMESMKISEIASIFKIEWLEKDNP
jgi:hypothetical protein